MTTIDKELCIQKHDINKKIYEIEYETIYITRWQVIAVNKYDANKIWLDNYKLNLKTDNTINCVCTSIKEDSEIHGTTEIASIKYDVENDEIYTQ